jgi:hypothetical protein
MTRNHSILFIVLILTIGAAAAFLLPRLIRAQGIEPLNRAAVVADLGNAFTYQGYLEDDGSPVEGNYDFRFYLYAEQTKATLVGTYPAGDSMTVAVSEGLFTVLLDFGEQAFNAQERWLEIEVDGVKLAPLQQLTPAPYALSLQPGAIISGDNESKGMLNLENASGPALAVTGAGESGVRVRSADM